MNNFPDAIGATNTALNSQGSALEENAKQMESVSGKIKSFHNAFQSLSETILSSDLLKFFIDLGTKTVQVFDAILQNGGKIPILFTALIALINVLIGTMKTLAGVELFKNTGAAFTKMFNHITILINEYKRLLVAQIQQQASTAALAGAQGTATLSSLSLSGAIKAVTLATIESMKAIIAWMLTNPVGWIVLIVTAIGGAVLAFDALTTSVEEQKEKISGLKTEYSALKSEISNLQTELKTVNDRMNELLAKENLTFLEKDELQNLKESNNQLKNSIELLERQRKIQEKQLDTAIVIGYQKEYEEAKVSSIEDVSVGIYGTETSEDVSRLERLEEEKRLYSELLELGSNRTEEQQQSFEASEKYLNDEAIALDKIAQGLSGTTEESRILKEETLDMIDIINNLLSPEKTKAESFSKIFDAENFKEAREELMKLSEAGELDSNVIASNEKFNALLKETKLTTEEVIEQINGLTTIPNPFDSLTKSIEDTKAQFKSMGDRMIDLESIQEKVNEKYTFSIKEIEEIRKNYAELEPYITRTSKGWEIQAGAIDTLSTGIRFSAEEIENLKNIHPELNTQIDATTGALYIEKESLDIVGRSAAQLKIDALNAQLAISQGVIAEIARRNSAFASEILGIKTVGEAYELLAKIKNQTTKTLAEAIKTQDQTEVFKSLTAGTPLGKFKEIVSVEAQANQKINAQMQKDAQEFIETVQISEDAVKQINMLQSQLTDLAAGGVSGGAAEKSAKAAKDSSSGKDAIVEAFEKDRKEIQYQLDKREIDQEEFYNRLQKLNEKYYKSKAKYLYEYRDIEIEVLQGLEKVQEDNFNKLLKGLERDLKALEQSISDGLDISLNIDTYGIIEKQTAIREKQIAIYNKQIEESFKMEQYYRNLGLKEDDDKITEQQDKRIELGNTIKETYENIVTDTVGTFDKGFEQIQDRIDDADFRISMLDESDYAGQTALINEKVEERLKLNKDLTNALNYLQLTTNESTRNTDVYKDSVKDLNDQIKDNIKSLYDLGEQQKDIAKAQIKEVEDFQEQYIELLKERYKTEEELANKAFDLRKKALEDEKDILKETHDANNEAIDEELKLLKKMWSEEDKRKAQEADIEDISALQSEMNKYIIAASTGDVESISRMEDLQKQIDEKNKNMQESAAEDALTIARETQEEELNAQKEANDELYKQQEKDMEERTKLLEKEKENFDEHYNELLKPANIYTEARLSLEKGLNKDLLAELIKYEEDYGKGMGILGTYIKNELTDQFVNAQTAFNNLLTNINRLKNEDFSISMDTEFPIIPDENIFTNLANRIKNALTKPFETAKDTFNHLSDDVKKDDVGNIMDTLGTRIKTGLTEQFVNAQTAFNNLLDNIKKEDLSSIIPISTATQPLMPETSGLPIIAEEDVWYLDETKVNTALESIKTITTENLEGTKAVVIEDNNYNTSFTENQDENLKSAKDTINTIKTDSNNLYINLQQLLNNFNSDFNLLTSNILINVESIISAIVAAMDNLKELYHIAQDVDNRELEINIINTSGQESFTERTFNSRNFRNMEQFEKGGVKVGDGLAYLHHGEPILTQKQWSNVEKLSNLADSLFSGNNNVNLLNKLNSNNLDHIQNIPSVNNTTGDITFLQQFSGITSEVMPKVEAMFKEFEQKVPSLVSNSRFRGASNQGFVISR